ncbi:hypothetical protein B7Z17_01755 [Candidatus Saccharibacteria bacterium 32-49-10]|nr:MAG: hypothetical protein B7Z17_01755 [Candidatus Saccharibacteria bacterium 32-49-10]
MTKKDLHIVIVGGGFGGIKAARELSKRRVGRITLISDEPHFLHHATLYSTATGKSYAESVIPLVDIFANDPDVEVVQDRISSLDEHRRIVVGKEGQYHYDELILAMGSVTTFFGIPGMKERAFGIKTLDEVKAFQNHIHDEVVDRRLDKEFFVIGGGPTGVELAGALNEYLKSLVHTYRITGSRSKVTLVEAAPRVVPRMSKTASRKVQSRLEKLGVRVHVNQKVVALEDDCITIGNVSHPTTTAVWTSGVANNPFFREHSELFALSPSGRVHVDEYLEAHPHVSVIGDNNDVKHSGMAWPALYQAAYVAKRIARTKNGRSIHPFRSHSVMCGVPIGEKWGYVEWYGVYVSGWAGAQTRRYMELYGYAQLVGLRAALPVWQAHYISEVDP